MQPTVQYTYHSITITKHAVYAHTVTHIGIVITY